MVIRGFFGAPARLPRCCSRIVAAWLLATVLAPAAHAQTGSKRILLYTGTTGFRHTDGINNGRPVVQAAIEAAGYTVDWENCTNNGGGANNCDNADKNPRIFTDENLARYDAIVLLNSSAGPPGPLWSDAQKASIIKYVQNGGGIAGVHNATDMGTTAETWNWWDGNNGNSVVGATMAGHAATSLANVAQVQVADHNHLATRDVPDTYGMGDEHYNFRRNVRGTHHVLATLDERTYTPGGNAMGQDHPVTWCKLYDGDNINDNTGTPKNYSDGRTWVTSMGHFGQSYTENPGNNNLIKSIVGGVRWVAGEGRKSDCSGTVWSAFTRQVIVADANNPIGIDVAKDGKVYWSEIGNPISLDLDGLREDVRPDRGGREQDHGHHDPDARGPRQLRGRRARHVAAARLRPRGSDQAQYLRLLLPAQRRVALERQRSGRRLEPDQPLDAQCRRHRSRRRLRARDPARSQGEDQRLAVWLRGRDRPTPAPATWAAPVSTSTPTGTSTSAWATTCPRTRAGTTAIRPWTSAPRSAGMPARPRRTPPTCAARSSASSRCSATSRPTRPRASTRRTRSRPATCSPRARRRPVPRSTRWASGSRSRCIPTRRTRASSASASTATTTRPMPPTALRPAPASGT